MHERFAVVDKLLQERYEVDSPFEGLAVLEEQWLMKQEFFNKHGLFTDSLQMDTFSASAGKLPTHTEYSSLVRTVLKSHTKAIQSATEKLIALDAWESLPFDFVDTLRYLAIDCVTIKDVVDNKLSDKYNVFNTKGNPGMKTSKFLTMCVRSKLADTGWPEEKIAAVTDIANQVLSMVFAATKRTGNRVVLSIDPVDMVLGSMATTGWTSCYDWSTEGQGAHAVAPFKLLTDEHAAVCFMETAKDTTVLNHTMKAKQNRAWVFFNAVYPAVVVGRVFPGDSNEFSASARTLCTTAIKQMYGIDKVLTLKDIQNTKRNLTINMPKPKAPWMYGDPWTDILLDPEVIQEVKVSTGVGAKETRHFLPPDFDVQFLTMAGMLAWCPRCGVIRGDYNNRNILVCGDCQRNLAEERRKLHKLRRCGSCNKEFRQDKMVEVSPGEFVCPYCADRYYPKCSCCGERKHINYTYNVDGVGFCEMCFKEQGYIKCTNCGKPFKKENATIIGGAPLAFCSACVGAHITQCSICGEAVLKRRALEVSHDKYICGKPECQAKIVMCRRCGTVTTDVVPVIHKSGVEGSWCTDCQAKVTSVIPYVKCAVCGTWVHEAQVAAHMATHGAVPLIEEGVEEQAQFTLAIEEEV